METTIVYLGYIRIMEKKMETTIVYWGHIGMMEKRDCHLHQLLRCWMAVASLMLFPTIGVILGVILGL